MKFRKIFLPFIFVITSFLSSTIIRADVKGDFKWAIAFVKKLAKDVKTTFKKTHKMKLSKLIEKLPPFNTMGLPPTIKNTLDHIILETPTITVKGDTYEIGWKDPLVFGFKKGLSVRLYIGPGKDGNKFGMSLSVGVPGRFTMNTLIPEVKYNLQKLEVGLLPEGVRNVMKKVHLSVDSLSKMADWLEFENFALILSTKFVDPVWGRVKLGLNVFSTTRMAGPLANLIGFFGKDLVALKYVGYVSPLLSGSEVRAIYPGKLTLVRFPIDPRLKAFIHVRGTGLEIRIGITKKWIPTFRLTGGLETILPGQTSYFAGKGFVDVKVSEVGPVAEVGGYTEGIIRDMFGFPGLNMRGFGYSLIFSISTPWILGFAGKGSLNIGPIQKEAIIKVDVPSKAVGIIFEQKEMNQKDFIDFGIEIMKAGVKKFKTRVDVNALKSALYPAVPPFTLGEVKFYIVPLGSIEIFDKTYPWGGHIKAGIEMFGLGGEMETSISLAGIKSYLYMKEIHIPKKNPFIIITGGGKNLKRGDADDGPVGLMELKLSRQIIYLDGLLKIPALGIAADTHILVNPIKGLEFDIKYKLGGLYDSELHIQGDPSSFDSFFVKGYMKDEARNAIGKMLTVEMGKFAKKANLDLLKALGDVSKWERQAKKDIDDWIKNKVAQTQWHIDRINKQISETKRKCAAGDSKACLAKVLIPAWEVEKLAHVAHKEITVKTLVKNAAKLGVGAVGNTSKLGLEVARDSVNKARNLSHALGGFTRDIFNIYKIDFKGTLKELLVEGKFAKVTVEGIIFKEKFKQDYQIDIKRPKQFIKQIANGLLQVLGKRKIK